jgi:hypothetical protein
MIDIGLGGGEAGEGAAGSDIPGHRYFHSRAKPGKTRTTNASHGRARYGLRAWAQSLLCARRGTPHAQQHIYIRLARLELLQLEEVAVQGRAAAQKSPRSRWLGATQARFSSREYRSTFPAWRSSL